MKRASFHTLGCKLNYAETSAIAEGFRREGFSVVEFGKASDVIVINSCTVTQNADRECRQIVRRALRANPQAFVIVTGCYAQLQPEEIASIDGVDLVLGSAEKFRIPELVQSFSKSDVPRVVVSDIGDDHSFGAAYSGQDDARTRAFLKVQDGCDYNCSFCTIPLARGASRSQGIEQAYADACSIVASGYREIVLTGVNVGDYGAKSGSSLYDLLLRLHDVPGLQRMRISSIEPNLLDDRIIALCAGSGLMLPHFHIPLQSGSDAVLAAMRRRYRSGTYSHRVGAVLAAMPMAAIGVDVIVGFPGETGEHFMETYNLLHALDVAYLHVFTYSERQNTPAADMGDPVSVPERRRRTQMLRTLSEKKRAVFAAKNLGLVRPVLFENAPLDGGAFSTGLTDNYIRVAVPYNPDLANNIVDVRVGQFRGEYCLGHLSGPVPANCHNVIRLPELAVLTPGD